MIRSILAVGRASAVAALLSVAALAAACSSSPHGAGASASATSPGTGAPATSPAPATSQPTSPGSGPCASRDLGARTGNGQSAAGSTYIPIVFTNNSNVTCTLYGY